MNTSCGASQQQSRVSIFQRLCKMIADYLKASSGHPFWWIMLLVLLAWSIKFRYAGIKAKDAARTRKDDNSHRKSKQGSKGIRKYNMNMGIRKLDREDWLRVDENFCSEHKIRSELLDNQKDKVLQCLPGSEDACLEALEVVVKCLTEKFPTTFQRSKSSSAGDHVHIVETGETFHIKAPFDDLEPLEIAARLTMEDLNILNKEWESGEYHL